MRDKRTPTDERRQLLADDLRRMAGLASAVISEATELGLGVRRKRPSALQRSTVGVTGYVKNADARRSGYYAQLAAALLASEGSRLPIREGLDRLHEAAGDD